MTTITALPTPPSTSDPANFDTRADAFLAALPTFRSEVNTVAGEVNTAASTATTAAGTATAGGATATAQAVLAAASAAAAAASAGATLWVTGTNYTAGAVVYSPTNYSTYRTSTSGVSSTDPAADTTGRWVSAMLPSAEATGLPTVRPSLLLNFLNSGALDPRVRVSRATTKTVVGPNGLTETLLAHQLKVDHNPTTLKALGLRVEPSRVNLVAAGRDMTAWGSSGGGTTVNNNSQIASDGTQTADEVVASAGTSDSRYLDITCTAAVHAVKYRLRAGTATDCMVALYSGGTPVAVTARILSGPGSVSGSGEITLTGLSTSQYTTVELVTNAALSSGTHRLYLWPGLPSQSAGDSTTVDWVQAEAGAASSSDIPDGVTRAADVVTVSGVDFSRIWNPLTSTMVVGLTLAASGASSAARAILTASNGTTDERITLYVSGGDSLVGLISDGGVEQAALSVARPAAAFVAAVAAQVNNVALVASASTAQTDTSATMPAPTQLNLGSDGGGANQLDGWLRFVAIYPARLSATELASVLTYYA